VRVLPEQLVHAVAGQAEERLVGKNNGIAAQGSVSHEHWHASPANGLDEQTTLLPDGVDMAFGDGPFRGICLVLLELVHGQSRMV
jgi:hypothetical protein